MNLTKYQKRILEFDGVYEDSTVWVNGIKVGAGLTDIPDFLRYPPYINVGRNVIAVRVDNTHKPADRWYSGAGIFREVRLRETSLSHIKPLGVYMTTPSISETEANVKVQVEVENSNIESKVEVIVDKDNQRVAHGVSDVQDNIAEIDIVVSNPELWEVENPALYSATIILYNGDSVCDTEQVRFGIRK